MLITTPRLGVILESNMIRLDDPQTFLPIPDFLNRKDLLEAFTSFEEVPFPCKIVSLVNPVDMNGLVLDFRMRLLHLVLS